MYAYVTTNLDVPVLHIELNGENDLDNLVYALTAAESENFLPKELRPLLDFISGVQAGIKIPKMQKAGGL